MTGTAKGFDVDRRKSNDQKFGTRASDEKVIDLVEIIRHGLNAMPDEDRHRLIRELCEEDRDHCEEEIPMETSEELALAEKRIGLKERMEAFNVKMKLTIFVVVTFVLMAMVFLGVFVWVAVTKGMLSEGGVFSSIATTLVEVLKILFSSNTGI